MADNKIRKISVIIPCYNVGPYIDRCMASVAAQTMRVENLEIICIDDASTDDTWEHLQDWEARLPDNIILFRQEINARQGAARNIGVTIASADWIAFVDADDWLEADYFEKLYAPVTRYECDVVSCGWEKDGSASLNYFEAGNRGTGEEQYIVADTIEIKKHLLRFKSMGQGPVAKIIRKSLLTDFRISFPEGLAYEDHYWTPLLHIYASRIYFVNERLYHYFVNPHSTSHASNQDYHTDWITVQVIKWAEYEKRGVFKEYREELEHDALRDAWGFLLWMIMHYDEPSFSLFQLEKTLINEHIPDYGSDPYLMDFPELYRFLLKLLYSSVNRAEFQQIARQIKERWVIS